MENTSDSSLLMSLWSLRWWLRTSSFHNLKHNIGEIGLVSSGTPVNCANVCFFKLKWLTWSQKRWGFNRIRGNQLILGCFPLPLSSFYLFIYFNIYAVSEIKAELIFSLLFTFLAEMQFCAHVCPQSTQHLHVWFLISCYNVPLESLLSDYLQRTSLPQWNAVLRSLLLC